MILALDFSTMPLHSRWPMFDVRESTCRPSVSRAMAKYPRSLTQKSRLKRRLRSAASFSSLSANSGSRVDADPQLDRLVLVVQDAQLLAEAVADRSDADHRELGVNVDGAGSRDQEEARLVVVEVVGRQ